MYSLVSARPLSAGVAGTRGFRLLVGARRPSAVRRAPTHRPPRGRTVSSLGCAGRPSAFASTRACRPSPSVSRRSRLAWAENP